MWRIISPLLFNLYVDDLLVDLESKKLGCCAADTYVGCIMYADDIMFPDYVKDIKIHQCFPEL